MDLNYLLSRHQISLMKSVTAGCVEARFAHGSLAEGYASRIDSLRESRRPRGMVPQKLARTLVAGGAPA
jgi:hypothetical protein